MVNSIFSSLVVNSYGWIPESTIRSQHALIDLRNVEGARLIISKVLHTAKIGSSRSICVNLLN